MAGYFVLFGFTTVGIWSTGTASIFGHFAKKNYIRYDYARSLNKDDMSTQEAQPVEEVVETMRNKRWSFHEDGVSRRVGLFEGFVMRGEDKLE